MLHYEFGTGIRNPSPFFELNQRYFGNYAGSDFHDFRMRLRRTRDGIAGAYFNGEPTAVLQTMRFQSGGNSLEIPKTSGELTGGETYMNYDPAGNTLVFVTFTVEPSLRHQSVNGSHLTDAALKDLISHYDGVEFMITYSPATRAAVKMHLRHGARPVMRLPKARPGLVIDGAPAGDVVVMGYEWPSYDMSILGDFKIEA